MGGWVAMAEVEIVEVAECDREGVFASCCRVVASLLFSPAIAGPGGAPSGRTRWLLPRVGTAEVLRAEVVIMRRGQVDGEGVLRTALWEREGRRAGREVLETGWDKKMSEWSTVPQSEEGCLMQMTNQSQLLLYPSTHGPPPPPPLPPRGSRVMPRQRCR